MRFIISIILVVYSLLSPTLAYAHDEAQPHFFLINGLYLEHYPISSTSLVDFLLPRELQNTVLEVGKEITFQVEPENIPLKNLADAERIFSIDFGDGEKQVGVIANHTYSYPGSYIVSVLVQQSLDEKESILTTALIHVADTEKYVLPKPVIKVNGELITKNEVGVDFSKPIRFEGSESTEKKIANYFWDLGDGKSSDTPTLTHTYASYHTGANILLRVKDSNGFISDTAIRLVDQKLVAVSSENKSPSSFYYLLAGVNSLIFLGVTLYFIKKRKTTIDIQKK